MLTWDFLSGARPHCHILCLGAHCDDIEIGCGGTILRLLRGNRNVSVKWEVFSSNETRAHEARNSAEKYLSSVRDKQIAIHRFRDGFFPNEWGKIKECFEQLAVETPPDVIFTHFRDDWHQDHRVISELTWNTFRNHLILEYEIPKFDGDLAHPNVFVHLDEPTCRTKIDNLLSCFNTQRNRHWFTEDTFLALMRLRGLESHSDEKYAEAFHCRKVVV